MKGGIYMTNNLLILNTSLKTPTDFIDSILYSNCAQQLPTCDFEESLDFYYININSFDDNMHLLEISYKYNFLILIIKSNNNSNKILSQRIFYLPTIDLNHILLHEHKNAIKLIIPKII
jgi:hypothetical protein